MSNLRLIQTYRESDNLVDWLQRLVGTVAEIENWREIGGTGNPAFENSWADVGGTNRTPAFYKDPFNVVHLRGEVDTGTNNTDIFTLPNGYYTGNTMRFPAILSGSTVVDKIVVGTSGGVKSVTGTAGVSLEGISFRV